MQVEEDQEVHREESVRTFHSAFHLCVPLRPPRLPGQSGFYEPDHVQLNGPTYQVGWFRAVPWRAQRPLRRVCHRPRGTMPVSQILPSYREAANTTRAVWASRRVIE